MIDMVDGIGIAAPLLRIVPVPLDEIAHAIGLPVEYATLAEDLASIIKRDGPQFRLLINQQRWQPRQRWALARGIAHVLLHGPLIKGELQDSQASTTRLGTYADKAATKLAAELIMPAAQVQKVWRDGLRDPDMLANHFGTSLRATSDRLSVLGLAA